VLWLLSLLIWFVRRGRRPVAASVPASPPPAPGVTQAAALKALRKACAGADPQQLRDAILAWGAARWPDSTPRGLGAVAQRLHNTAARETLVGLERVLYAGAGFDIDCEALARDLQAEGEAAAAPRDAAPLPGLYPGRSN
jgi:hypothetical protein